MKRRAFLKRSGAVIGGLYVAGRLPAAPVEAAVTASEAPAVFGGAGVAMDSLVASGGLCAPLTPYYELVHYDGVAHPVRDGLPQFTATRGGLRFKGTSS